MDVHPYGWLSLLPPIVAIVLAIVTRRIVLSLVLGIFAGALVMANGRPLLALGHTWETHLWSTMIDPGKLRMFSFTLLMGAMIGVITRSGGMQGLVRLITPYASNRRRGQLATWLLGIVVFFDDYANTMLLGGTMQSVYDRLKISREKLAYVVDSTAAPVAALAPLSTWVAIEIDSIASGLESLPDSELGAFGLFIASIPYRFYVWMALLLVPLTAILGRDFGMMWRAERATIDGDGKTGDYSSDVGQDPSGQEQPKPASAVHALLPILATLAVVVYLVYTTGASAVCTSAADKVGSAIEPWADQMESSQVAELQTAAEAGNVAETRREIAGIASSLDKLEPGKSQTLVAFQPKLSLQDIFGAADSAVALQYGSLIGLGLAMLLSWCARILSIDQLLEGAFAGARVVLPAVAILWCAAAMSRMTTDSSVAGETSDTPYAFKDHRLYTAKYLTTILVGADEESSGERVEENGNADVEMRSGGISLAYLPTVVFLLSGVVAFCTGTSWGTMGILLPMVVQTAYTLLTAEGLPVTADNPILISSVGGVLAGAVFGDHCSPISDTTVLSSQWSGCDHLAHVWTQLPYALLAATVAVLCGTLPIGFGVSVWLLLPLQVVGMFIVLWTLGRKVE